MVHYCMGYSWLIIMLPRKINLLVPVTCHTSIALIAFEESMFIKTFGKDLLRV